MVVVSLLLVDLAEGKRKRRRRGGSAPIPDVIYKCDSLLNIAAYFALQMKNPNQTSVACGNAYKLLHQSDNIGVTGVWKVRIWGNKAKKLLVFAGRGTAVNSLRDWQNDLRASGVKCDDPLLTSRVVSITGGCGTGLIHKGFAEEWAESKTTLVAALKTAIQSGDYTKLVVAGHSKGGAIALFVAAEVKANLATWRKPDVLIRVFAFGAPRSGDPNFVRFWTGLGIPYTRYAVSGDPVPHTPPVAMGYAHVGGENTAIPLTCSWTGMLTACHTEYYQLVAETWSGTSPTLSGWTSNTKYKKRNVHHKRNHQKRIKRNVHQKRNHQERIKNRLVRK